MLCAGVEYETVWCRVFGSSCPSKGAEGCGGCTESRLEITSHLPPSLLLPLARPMRSLLRPKKRVRAS